MRKESMKPLDFARSSPFYGSACRSLSNDKSQSTTMKRQNGNRNVSLTGMNNFRRLHIASPASGSINWHQIIWDYNHPSREITLLSKGKKQRCSLCSLSFFPWSSDQVDDLEPIDWVTYIPHQQLKHKILDVERDVWCAALLGICHLCTHSNLPLLSKR